MASPRSSTSVFATPTSFGSITDPTLHRRPWRSTLAQDEQPRPNAFKIPSRFRGLLRYDLLRPENRSLFDPPAAVRTRELNGRYFGSVVSSASAPAPPADATGPDPNAALMIPQRVGNSDELKWLQHRWLDKHGKNSQLKEYREQIALMRRWFTSLDADGSGEVGVDELEDPLVSVGLARSRGDVQKLIDGVDRDGSGEVTFGEFLHLMHPKKVKRSKNRLPLHSPKPRPVTPDEPEHTLQQPAATVPESVHRQHSAKSDGVVRPAASASSSSSSRSLSSASPVKRPTRPSAFSPKARPPKPTDAAADAAVTEVNPVVKLFEDLQAGKLGDLAIPFPVLITAYRRRMLLNAHMAEDPAARELGSSVLQALEHTRHEAQRFHSRNAHAPTHRQSCQRPRTDTMPPPSSLAPSPDKSVPSSRRVSSSSSGGSTTSSPGPTQLPSLNNQSP